MKSTPHFSIRLPLKHSAQIHHEENLTSIFAKHLTHPSKPQRSAAINSGCIITKGVEGMKEYDNPE
jgi:hypothetical protein